MFASSGSKRSPDPMREPSGSTQGSAGVVLLVPEALGETADSEGLRKTLAGPPRPARVLLCLTGGAGHELANTVAQLGLDLQILLAADAPQPQTKAYCLRAPAGMSPNDQIEFALALGDAVLVAPAADQHPAARLAAKLGKTIVAPGAGLPPLALEAFAHGLDPTLSGRRRINGRVEQWMVESLAFAWSGWNRDGRAESWKRLRRCLGPGWGPAAYFAPDGWHDVAPDRAAIDAPTRIVASFETMDRSALHGSYRHRDIVWLTHFGAAFAVFAAVAGYVWGPAIFWGILEIATLTAVASAVYRARRSDLQDRWTACRFAAEQLRIARMSLPLLVLPPALATADDPPPGHGDSKDRPNFLALAEVKRVVRDQGLPQLDHLSLRQAAGWLHLIVSDQIAYHRRNHHKLERAEARLRALTQSLFAITVVAVLAHLVELSPVVHRHDNWLLLITAAGPAAAAALHGAGTRLGIVHRAALSEEMEKELSAIDVSLVSFGDTAKDPPEAWKEVRGLAYAAANAMGRENTSWHGLVRRYRDELP
jgi:hypothetical protein